MKKQSVLCIFLASLFVMSSCGGGEDIPAETGTAAATAETTAETVETEILPDLPDVTFGGAEFNVLKWDAGNGVHNYFEFDVEELTGELLNDSIYNRNMEIEEQYDVTISTISENPPPEPAFQGCESRRNALSGDHRLAYQTDEFLHTGTPAESVFSAVCGSGKTLVGSERCGCIQHRRETVCNHRGVCPV